MQLFVKLNMLLDKNMLLFCVQMTLFILSK